MRRLRIVAILVGAVVCIASAGPWVHLRNCNEELTLRIPRPARQLRAHSLHLWCSRGGPVTPAGLVLFLRSGTTRVGLEQRDVRFEWDQRWQFRRTHPQRTIPSLAFFRAPSLAGFSIINGGADDARAGATNVSIRDIGIGMPWWFIMSVATAVAARSAWVLRSDRRRRDPNRCKSCGYDLRAGHDKCPECGGESHVKIGASNSTNTPSAPTVQR